MYDDVLKRFRENILQTRYVVTNHARKEMNEDDLSIFDVESGILTGRIIERQKDHLTGEWKYRVSGETIDNKRIEVLVKMSPTGKMVVITVYAV